MKNTPFKMKGFSGFGNSPLKQTGDVRDFTRSNWGGGPRTTKQLKGKGKSKFASWINKLLFRGTRTKQEQGLKFWCSGKDC
tara:strand:+ start:233 stop:475 length:243 start_codon:yes stop_codon:yes gene_type:complete